MLWTISSGKIAGHLEYVIDGVEEAVGELMQGIQMTKKFKDATGPSTKSEGTQTYDDPNYTPTTTPKVTNTPKNSIKTCTFKTIQF